MTLWWVGVSLVATACSGATSASKPAPAIVETSDAAPADASPDAPPDTSPDSAAVPMTPEQQAVARLREPDALSALNMDRVVVLDANIPTLEIACRDAATTKAKSWSVYLQRAPETIVCHSEPAYVACRVTVTNKRQQVAIAVLVLSPAGTELLGVLTGDSLRPEPPYDVTRAWVERFYATVTSSAPCAD